MEEQTVLFLLLLLAISEHSKIKRKIFRRKQQQVSSEPHSAEAHLLLKNVK